MKKLLVLIGMAVLIISGCEKKVDVITMDEAKEYALKAVDGVIVSEKADVNDDDPNYEFSIISNSQKYDIEVDAQTGDIISKELDEDYVPPVNKNAPDEHDITREEAQNIALGSVGSGEVRSVQLDHEVNHTNCVWEVEIVKDDMKYDFDINAITGEIIGQDQDSIYD